MATLVLNGCHTCIIPSFREQPRAVICCNRYPGTRGPHLECRNEKGGRALALNFFRRVGYHFFESINHEPFIRAGVIEYSNLTAAPYALACTLSRFVQRSP